MHRQSGDAHTYPLPRSNNDSTAQQPTTQSLRPQRFFFFLFQQHQDTTTFLRLHRWTTPKKSPLIGAPSLLTFVPQQIQGEDQRGRGKRGRGEDIKVAETERDENRRVHCGWDSPAPLTHSVFCWSLHVGSPGPPRQSCKTKTQSDTWPLCPVGNPRNIQYMKSVSSLIQKWQLQHLLLPKSVSHFMAKHKFLLCIFCPLLLCVSLFGRDSADMVTCAGSGGQPSFWLRRGSWLNYSQVIDGEWLEELTVAHMVKCKHTIKTAAKTNKQTNNQSTSTNKCFGIFLWRDYNRIPSDPLW